MLQWKIGNISDMFLPYSVLCGLILKKYLDVKKTLQYATKFDPEKKNLLTKICRMNLNFVSIFEIQKKV